MQGIRLNKHTKTIRVVNRQSSLRLDKQINAFKVVNRRANLKLQHSGKVGPAGSVTVGSTTTLDPGEQAYVVNTGTLQQAILEFFIPRGEKGDKGDTGYSTFNRAHHGSNANFPRPDAQYVEWVGSVAPVNATTEDTWVDVI